MQFQVHRSSNGQYWWRIVAANGRVLASSETYHNKQDAINACGVVKAGAAGAPIYDHTV
jgi:uncharacterized protein YegP (UPF0339 family)